jgi:outer membrane lipoprotein-sorting protein
MKALKLVLTGLVAILSIVTVQAQTLDEVIGKYLDAIGGKEKLLVLKTIVTDATMSVQGTDIPIKITQWHNKGQRIDINFNGMANYIIQTPTEGWTFLPVQGQTKPEASPETTVKETADALDVQSPLLNYKEKGHDVTLVGKEDVEGTECFKLKLKMKGGLEQTIFIDPSTYYIIKIVNKTKATGQEQEQTQTFSNYKKLDSGYVFAFSMTGFGPGELTVSKIQVNVPVDEKVFKIN